MIANPLEAPSTSIHSILLFFHTFLGIFFIVSLSHLVSCSSMKSTFSCVSFFFRIMCLYVAFKYHIFHDSTFIINIWVERRSTYPGGPRLGQNLSTGHLFPLELACVVFGLSFFPPRWIFFVFLEDLSWFPSYLLMVLSHKVFKGHKCVLIYPNL